MLSTTASSPTSITPPHSKAATASCGISCYTTSNSATPRPHISTGSWDAPLDLIPAPETEFEGRAEVLEVLEQSDILARERGLDRLLWDKIDELTQAHVLDLDVILGMVAKVKITDRWNKLDPKTGRALFRSLVQEIRNTR